MSSEINETSKDKELEGGNQQSINETTMCSPDTPNIGESTVTAFTKCDDMISSKKRKAPYYVDNHDIQKSNHFNINEKYNYEELDRLYVRRIGARKLNNQRNICPEEKPLDFSTKPVSLDSKYNLPPKYRKFAMYPTVTSRAFQEYSGNSSDCLDDSCDSEGKSEPDTVSSHPNGTKEPKVELHMNGSESAVCDGKGVKPLILNRRRLAKWGRNGNTSNGLQSASSSGSEDEFRSEHSVQNGRIYKPNGDQPECKSYFERFQAEMNKFRHLHYTLSEKSNLPSENGSSISTEKNDRFHIQGLLGRDNQPTSVSEDRETVHQITEQRSSPQSTFNHIGKDNIPSKSTSPCQTVNSPPGPRSPNHSVNFPLRYSSPNPPLNFPNGYANTNPPLPPPPTRFPFPVTDGLPDSNGMIPPYMQTMFPPNHNLMAHSFPRDVSDYCRMYSYPPGTMLQPPLNPMFVPSYQPSMFVPGQDQPKQKKHRPFKEIDPSVILQHVPLADTILGLSSSSTQNSPATRNSECNAVPDADSSPQRRSPDSQCVVNVSSGNELAQDSNDDGGRKKIRRIPPEEKDEKYLEKRRKNNLAAKKSRDERRKKEDVLAVSVKKLIDFKIKLEGKYDEVQMNLHYKEQTLNMVIGNLIRFREKCEGPMKELFDDTFKLFLPPE